MPSPFEGQLRRAHQLYKVAESKSTDDDNDDDDINNGGDNDDQQNVKVAHDREVEILDGVRKTCASSGVLAFVAKRVEFNGRSFSLARVLSGTLHIGSDLRQLPSDSDQETKGKVTALALVVGAGRDIARVEKAEAGLFRSPRLRFADFASLNTTHSPLNILQAPLCLLAACRLPTEL